MPPTASTPPGRPRAGWLAAQGRLPLAFMGLGLAWLAAGTALLAFNPWLLALPHTGPPVVALTHAWVLGFFATVAFGAVYQLAPVALGTTLASERRGWWHFWLHAIGVPGMVYSFWHWDLEWLGHFGLVVAVGIALFADNTWRTVRRSGKRNPVAWSLGLAAGWLLLTAVAGLVLAANRYWYFIPLSTLALLRAHAHLGLIGFFVTLLQGVAFQLVPMFTLGEVRGWRPAAAGLGCTQAALLGLVPSLAFEASGWGCAFALLLLSGFAVSGWGLVRALATRRKREIDPGVRSLLRGLATLGVATGAGVALLWPGSPWGSAPGGFNAVVYAIVVFLGVLLPCIAGMMCKIVPFLTWMRVYGPRVGRGPTPSAGSLGRPRLERWALALQSLAAIPLIAGAWILSEPLLRAGAFILAAGVLLFVVDMAGVFRHLWRPVEVSRPRAGFPVGVRPRSPISNFPS
ncbi:MAG: hypothetical protein ACREFX_07235 [Opitutaceae bacterium]